MLHLYRVHQLPFLSSAVSPPGQQWSHRSPTKWPPSASPYDSASQTVCSSNYNNTKRCHFTYTVTKMCLDSKISVNTESYLLGSLFGYGITINWEFGIIDDHALFRISWKINMKWILLPWKVYSILKLYLFLPGLYPKFRVFTCVVCFFFPFFTGKALISQK